MIAEHLITGIWPDGLRQPIRFAIDAPFYVDSGEWRCHLTVDPLFPKGGRDICGDDSMQALCLALSLGLGELEHFVSSGGQLLYYDGTPHSLDVLGVRRSRE